MTMFYNLIEHDSGKTLGSFVTSLPPATLKTIAKQTEEKRKETNRYKGTVFFELVSQKDPEFQEITPEEISL